MSQGTGAPYWLEDAGDYLCLQWLAGSIVGAAEVIAANVAVAAASPQGPRPLLERIGLVKHISAEAKQLLIRDVSSARVAIVGDDNVGRVLTAFTHRSVTPTRYFTADAEALEWLLDDVREHPSIFGESYGVNHAFSSQMCDGVLCVTWTQVFHITEAVAENLLVRAEFMNPTSCPPMLLELHQVMSATDGAMRILADALNIAALAVVSADIRGQTLVAYYRQRARPPYTTRYFPTVVTARTWLAGQHVAPHTTGPTTGPDTM